MIFVGKAWRTPICMKSVYKPYGPLCCLTSIDSLCLYIYILLYIIYLQYIISIPIHGMIDILTYLFPPKNKKHPKSKNNEAL